MNFFVLRFLFLALFLLLSTACEETGNADKSGSAHKGSIDSTKPIITLIGKSTITLSSIEDFKHYKDPGATAMDDMDGDITDKIKTYVMGSTSDESSTEVYVYTYRVSDSSGNRAKSVKRKVTVLKQ